MNLKTSDYRVQTKDGVGLRVRACSPESGASQVIVMLHGISAPLVPTFDLPIPGYSFIEEVAGRGYHAVAFDHRNYGASDRDPRMNEPPVEDPEGKGIHTMDDSIVDIHAVIEDAKSRYGVDRVVLFGSSRGAIQGVAYALAHPEHLHIAVLNNPSTLCYLAGAREGKWLEAMREAHKPTLRGFNYLLYTEEMQRKRWSKLFGEGSLVSEEVQEAYIKVCLDTDPEEPNGFRVPVEAIPFKTPLLPLEELTIPCLLVEGEEKKPEHIDFFMSCVPEGLARMVRIHDTDHFTLRNARRFELANLLDVAAAARRWGAL
jgi:pimeloyl-ACP methyl ester carboxylesterase